MIKLFLEMFRLVRANGKTHDVYKKLSESMDNAADRLVSLEVLSAMLSRKMDKCGTEQEIETVNYLLAKDSLKEFEKTYLKG